MASKRRCDAAHAEEAGQTLVTPRAVAEEIQKANAEIRDACIRRARLYKAHVAASMEQLTFEEFERLL